MNDEIYDSLNGFWQKVIDDLVQSLKDVNRFASGVTAQSIGAFNVQPVTVISEGFEITIAMPSYWQFMDLGVSGAKNNKDISPFSYKDKGKGKGGRGQKGLPPVSAIRKFMLNRSIVGKDFRAARASKGKGRQQSIDKALNNVAYAIAYKIWRDGLKPTHFFSDVVNEKLLTKFENEIANDYSQLIIDSIKLK